MPLYEFKCPLGHVTEKLLPISKAETKMVRCEHGKEGARRMRGRRCSFIAQRVAASATGSPILKKGSGGFYKPTD